MIQDAPPPTAGPDDRDLFMRYPALYADPARLASCFGEAISPVVCKRLAGTERLTERLSRLLAETYNLPGSETDSHEPVAEHDKPVAFASVERLTGLAVKAGAVYRATMISNCISGRDAATLHELLGPDLCRLAIANKNLSGPEQAIHPFKTLRDRIAADGWQCLAAWCETVGPTVAARVRLKLPRDHPLESSPAAEFHDKGPIIVRRVAK